MVQAASSSAVCQRSSAWLTLGWFMSVSVSACSTPTTPAPAPPASASASAGPPAPSPPAEPSQQLLARLAGPGALPLPYDVDVKKVSALVAKNDIRGAQREFDELSWQAFLALNWPALPDGKADASKTLADVAAPRTWLFWRPADTIFLAKGARPTPWKTEKASEDLYRGKAAWRQNANQPRAKANETFQAFSGPLVDQNGKWVRYQVLVNHEEFDYIYDNKLYNLDGQAEFSQTTKLDEKGKLVSNGSIDFPSDDAATGRHGAIEIKLAWKELSTDEQKSNRFFSVPVTVTRILSQAELDKRHGEPLVETVQAGLVGMHIAMHTVSSPEWIWATFEQVDNVRPHENDQKVAVNPSFANPKLGGCPKGVPDNTVVNVLAPHNGYLAFGAQAPVDHSTQPFNTWIESKTQTPVQVCRVEVPDQGQLNSLDAALRADAEKLNGEVQAQLNKLGSVFQYYELIDTQWPIHPNAPAVPGGNESAPESIAHKTPGDVVPVFLVNSIMETFFQKGAQEAGPLEQDDRLPPGSPSIDPTPVVATESCVGCHYSAGICIGFKKDEKGDYLIDANGQRRPIYGENGHFGKTGHANFSWLFQIEAQAVPFTPPNAPPAPAAVAPTPVSTKKNPAAFLKSGLTATPDAHAAPAAKH